MKPYLLSIILSTILFSCNGQDCSKIPQTFQTYAEAKRTIAATNFALTENLNTSKSSWIRSAQFFSCDSRKGFMIFKTDKEEYIHQDLPISIWNNFKQAVSFGSFYSSNIKKKYQLKLRQ